MSLGVAIAVALAAYSMPLGQVLDSALLGAAFGLFPIMWIVWNAIWIYRMTEATGTSRSCAGRSGGYRATSACKR